jgi:hypothetical protein
MPIIKKDKNYLTDLSTYIKKNVKKGYTTESLKWALISQGHSKLEVEKAMQLAQSEMAREAPTLKTKPEIKVEIVEPKGAELSEKKWWKFW